ncbi:MAG TPA: protein kinase, partial [Terriglobales bacterium]|nr:protein kinase [Terriglobales bacterium]
MEEFSRGRPDGKPSDAGEGGAALRTPSKGDSSSPGTTAPSDSPTLIDIPNPSTPAPASDSPTMVDIPGGSSSDSPTLVDLGPDSPTMVEGASPLPGKPAPRIQPRPQSNPSMLAPGALLGQRYEVLQILGEGGMGAVYKARDIELNRMVALKVIRPDLAGNQAIIDRFKQELLLATQVTHKNVIRIYDLSEADGMKFITMEFVEGEDLRGLMQKKGKLAPEEAVEIMQQTCRALEAAHSAGIIHRDLKPQNIMRDKTGRVLVMDFGLARTLEGDGMTQTGALVGTMDYMSPEQALGKDLDQRSDVFAMGLIFYELLTGKMPYKADSVVASLLKRTQERAAPVSSHDASIPCPLSNIVGKCMEPDLKLRYQSSAEILADLDAWQ